MKSYVCVMGILLISNMYCNIKNQQQSEERFSIVLVRKTNLKNPDVNIKD